MDFDRGRNRTQHVISLGKLYHDTNSSATFSEVSLFLIIIVMSFFPRSFALFLQHDARLCKNVSDGTRIIVS